MSWHRAPSILAISLFVITAGCLSGSGDDEIEGTAVDGPIAAFVAVPGDDGAAFDFDASASRGEGLTYAWSFGDGSTATGKKVSHSYTVTNGVVAVVLTVTDDHAATAQAVQGVNLGTAKNAVPEVALKVSADWVTPGTEVTVDATTSDADGDDVTLRIGTAFLGERASEDLVPEAEGGEGDGHEHHHGGAGDPAPYTPAENGFDSPEFPEGDSYALTLDEPGFYDYHCHPHPWMVGGVLVLDDPDALGGTVTVSAWNAQHFLPRMLVVKPGATVVWDNPDPVPHTATLSKFLPITDLVEHEGGKARLTFDREGVYTVVAIATDAKGASAYRHALVMVSAEVPPEAVVESWSGEVAAPASEAAEHAWAVHYPGRASVEFAWTSVSPGDVSTARLDVYKGTVAAGTPVVTTRGGSVSFTLEPGDYRFAVTNEQAVQVSYDVALSAVLDVEPDFTGGGGHAAHHH